MFWILPGANLRRMCPFDWSKRTGQVTGWQWQPRAPTRMAAAVNYFQTIKPSGLVPYRLIFDTGAYFAAQGIDGLYPVVEITFQVRDGESHFHIPLLLSPNGYTTYRGS